MDRTRVPVLRFLLAIALVFPLGLRAESIPPSVQIVLLLKVLSFDRKLPDRATDGKLTFVVLYKKGNAESESTHNDLMGALQAASARLKITGLTITPVAVGSTDKTGKDLEAVKPSVVYLCPGLSDRIPDVLKSAKDAFLTLSGSEEYVRAGVGVGVVQRENRPSLFINVKATREQGADLDSAVLKLAEVI